jgi:hypothetical protein
MVGREALREMNRKWRFEDWTPLNPGGIAADQAHSQSLVHRRHQEVGAESIARRNFRFKVIYFNLLLTLIRKCYFLPPPLVRLQSWQETMAEALNRSLPFQYDNYHDRTIGWHDPFIDY